MNNVSLQNNPNINQQQRVLEKQANQPEFSAIDKEKIKQDTLEIAQQGHEAVKENWVFSTLRNVFHIEDPKKFLTSLGLTLGTVVGLAYLGNKSVGKMADLGLKVDDMLANNKLYQSMSQLFKTAKNKTVDTLSQSKTMSEVFDAVKNRKATPKADLTRGYGRGFVSIFSLTPVDIIKTALEKKRSAALTELSEKLGKETPKFVELLGKDSNSALDILQKIYGENSAKAQQIIDDITGFKTVSKLVGENKAQNFLNQILGSEGIKDNRKFCSEITTAIAENFGLKDKKALKAFFDELKEGSYEFNAQRIDFSELTGVTMDKGGLIGAWWPVNIINSIGKKIFKGSWKEFGKGNLGDSLTKFNIVNGSLADTKIGSLVQKSILVPTESISNFVNDKSGLGAFLCASIMSLYNNVQDAPNDKKVATVADDYIGTMGSIAISTPMAFATTYGLASLKNLEGTTITSKILKNIGKFFGMGLDKIAKDGTVIKGTTNPIIRFTGGALRFVLIMFVFSNMFSKPIRGAIHKIFGKPYDKAEEQKKAELEAQKNKVIPELGITNGEFLQKMQNNPEAIKKIQSDPKLAEELNKNPKLLLDFLDGKEINFSASANSSIPQNNEIQLQMSPYNTQFIKNRMNSLNKTPENTTKNIQETKSQPIDTATYIPSSDFIAPTSLYSNEEMDKINKVMQNADKALKRAEKYI